ncbi:hypothetical protein Aduo_015438 [Ancylostoma duodenale]
MRFREAPCKVCAERQSSSTNNRKRWAAGPAARRSVHFREHECVECLAQERTAMWGGRAGPGGQHRRMRRWWWSVRWARIDSNRVRGDSTTGAARSVAARQIRISNSPADLELGTKESELPNELASDGCRHRFIPFEVSLAAGDTGANTRNARRATVS